MPQKTEASARFAGQLLAEGFGFPVVDEFLLPLVQSDNPTHPACIRPDENRVQHNVSNRRGHLFRCGDKKADALDKKCGGGFSSVLDLLSEVIRNLPPIALLHGPGA